VNEKRLLQFIGTQRSGSNLLRVMLDQIDGVVAPHPPHILITFIELLPLYGNLEKKENFAHLVDDVCSWIENNPVPWEGVVFDRNEIQKKCISPTLIEVFRLVYEKAAEARNAKYWSCKSMANTHFFEKLEELRPAPIYLYLYRDGRDVALSFKKAYVGEKHIFSIAKKWNEDQEKSLEICEKVPKERVVKIRYEDMLADSEKTIRDICKVLKIPFQNKFSSYYKSKEATNTSIAGEMWQNLSKPIMKDNFNKYRTGLTKEEIEIFESIAGNSLKALGYSLDNDENSLKRTFDDSEVKDFEKANKQLKQDIKKNTSSDELRRKEWQETFLMRCKNEMSQMA